MTRMVTALLCAVLFAGCANQNNKDKTPGISIEIAVKEVNDAIAKCKAAQTKDCRNEMLALGMSYFDMQFMKKVPLSRYEWWANTVMDLPENLSPIVLPKLAESEERRLPILIPLLDFLKNIVGIDPTGAKLARAEADLLRYKVGIRERYPLTIADYTVNEALLDLARYRKTAGVD